MALLSFAMHVLLIGLRASGKTTLGRSLAASLQRPFIDLDDDTARVMHAASAADAIRTQGLSAFRLAEATALRAALAQTKAAVISLGGGTPTAPGAAEIIRDSKPSALAIYLRARPATLQARLRHSDISTRPSLTGACVIDEVPALFAQRDPIYRGIAAHVLDIDHMDQPQALAALHLLVARH